LSEIVQSAAESLMIWQIFAVVRSRCDLDLWPLDLELSFTLGKYGFSTFLYTNLTRIL